jgi:hypothetical protein
MQQQNSNQQSRSLNLQDLSKKNKPELQAICKELLGEEPHESLTRQQLIDAIVAAQPAADENAQAPAAPAAEETIPAPEEVSGPFYGNKDEDKKHLLPADWAKKVCVYQCQIEQMNGGVVEIPNTHQLQTYDPAYYTKLIADEKGKPSFFSESKMKVVVLHDPR